MDIVNTRLKLEKIEASYPEIKDVIDSILDSVAVTEIGTDKQADPTFLKELIDLKGIGKMTAENIVKIFPNRDSLITEIKRTKYLPFRKDICLILKAKYGSI